MAEWKKIKLKKRMNIRKNGEFHCIWTFFPQSPYQFLCWRVYVIKISALGKYLTSNLNLLHLKYVDKAAAELWVEVQIEQMSFVLLLLQNLTKARLDALSVFLLSRLLSTVIVKWKATLERTFPAALCSSRFCSVVFACSAASCNFCNIFNALPSCFRLFPVISFFAIF